MTVLTTHNLAYTSTVNPTGASSTLTRAQLWSALLFKIKSAESFVPLISATKVINDSVDSSNGNAVTTRELTFTDRDNHIVTETVTAYPDNRVDFVQTDNGSWISHIISNGAEEGQLYLTVAFEWRHPGASEEEMAAFMAREKMISKSAVEGTLAVARKMVAEGKL